MNYSSIINTFKTPIWYMVSRLPEESTLGQLGKLAAASLALYYVSGKIYCAFFGPLRSIPGPFIDKFFYEPEGVLFSQIGKKCIRYLKYHEKYGPVVRVGPNTISVSDKGMLKQVLSTEDLEKGPVYSILQNPGNESMFDARDKSYHKNNRRMFSPAFSVKYINSIEPIMRTCTETMARKIDSEIKRTKGDGEFGTVDLWLLFQCLALDVIGESGFGTNFKTIEEDDHAIPKCLKENMNGAAYFVSHPWITLLIAITGFMTITPLATHMLEIVRDRVEGKTKRREDILQIIIDNERAKNGDKPLDIMRIARSTVMFVIVGSETTSNTTGFAIIELCRSPEAMKKLRDEIDAIEMPEGEVTFHQDQLKNLPYLNAVLNETLRLDSITAAGLERIATQDSVLGGSLFVPKGTIVNCNILSAHHRADYWPEPLSFIPERWLDGYEHKPALDAYHPFSSGSRNCIGKSYALNEMRHTIATIIKKYDIKPIPEEMESSKNICGFLTLTVRTGSFKVHLKPRSA
ncbi:cytochrome P450 [Phycomyces nitens]|nr:cytochrome P450 [Phycomyces nitens]